MSLDNMTIAGWEARRLPRPEPPSELAETVQIINRIRIHNVVLGQEGNAFLDSKEIEALAIASEVLDALAKVGR
jgi:hypothetical protein